MSSSAVLSVQSVCFKSLQKSALDCKLQVGLSKLHSTHIHARLITFSIVQFERNLFRGNTQHEFSWTAHSG